MLYSSVKQACFTYFFIYGIWIETWFAEGMNKTYYVHDLNGVHLFLPKLIWITMVVSTLYTGHSVKKITKLKVVSSTLQEKNAQQSRTAINLFT